LTGRRRERLCLCGGARLPLLAALRLLFLGLASLALARGFVCPPVEEGANKVHAAGMPCGGTCDVLGVCADGFKCVVPQKTVSPFSFAIASFGLGADSKEGVCQPVERRNLQFVAGGARDADLDSPEIIAAAKQATVMVLRSSNSLTPPTLKRVVSAKTQVVAGIKYTLELEMSDNSRHRVELVDQPWMDERYSMLKDEVVV